MASDILIVDDEADIRDIVSGILSDEGHGTRTAADADAALAEIGMRRPSLVFLDIWLQGSRIDGLALLDAIKAEHADLPVVMISGHGNIETAVSAIRRGAYDYIEKPFKSDRLVLVAERALEASTLRREVMALRERTGDASELIGGSPAINHLRQALEKIAPTNSRVMISGPSGSGKETVARAIHRLSGRATGPFVVINAAAITPDSMERELFGMEPHNGAGRKVGALEEAHGGTLYLDEVGDMPRETQNKILRVLVDQSFQRVGGGTRVNVDVRVVSSTARDLEREVAEGTFREDLFHRLAVVPLRVPALAERREDIPDLVHHFVEHISRATGLPQRAIGADAMAVLQAHDWPGNLRQLRNNMERLLILARGDAAEAITAEMLPAEIGEMLPTTPGRAGGE
ncbi:MAG: sigma-54 dependent transcriptional regulator, partial [Bauldia sp.]|nr:sigma-54 dependent transcriptional regulator [Bauldia sp.]